MALIEIEKAILDRLIEAERVRRRESGASGFWWLSEKLEAGELRVEALRLVGEARAAKQIEVDNWPARAQATLVELRAELARLQALESKLTP